MSMTTGSLSEYARHIGASPAYVSNLRRQGRLVMREVDGKQVVDFELSDRLVRNTTDLGRAGNGRNASPAAEPTRPVAPLADRGRVDVIFRQAQAQERAFAAKLEELKYRELAWQLIRVDAVRAAWASRITLARDALLQIPHRLAPVLDGSGQTFTEVSADRLGETAEVTA